MPPDEEPPIVQQSHARRGAFIGSMFGIITAWRIIAGTFDPTVTEHQAIFPVAMEITCGFAVGVFLALTLAGLAFGSVIKR